MCIEKIPRKNMHVHSAGVEKKEADSFTPAQRKKHNELNTHARMCTNTHI